MRKFQPVNEENLSIAAEIHALSWKESHKSFCSAEFVALHTVERQANYLRSELASGKQLFLLSDGKPVGLVSVKDDLIENLYVLPGEQGKGYGTELLHFAIRQCAGNPTLWILNNNQRAYMLYTKHGFQPTGNIHPLSGNLYELELKKG